MVNEAEVQGRVKAVRACLNAKDFSGALHKALESPPQNSNNAALKVSQSPPRRGPGQMPPTRRAVVA